MKYLVLYSTTDGHTKVIAKKLVEEIYRKDNKAKCTLRSINVFMTENTLTAEGVEEMEPYDKVVLGANVRYHNFTQEVRQFMKQYAEFLNSIPTAMFIVSLSACNENKRTPETNMFVRRFLRACPWKPTKAAVFAGALYYPRYSFFDRCFIRLIMKLNGGETDPTVEKVYTDWNSVKTFAGEVVRMKRADVPIALEKAAEEEKEGAIQERARRLYRWCVVGVVAGVAAVTGLVSQRRKLLT
uniref:Protoporphyrinogen oxidase n=1 Tax=Strigomonas galati TaxID=1003336 RepID=G1C9P6_9TRYP|nr:protoporphyrinogen oxidase [Strigomonas galati]